MVERMTKEEALVQRAIRAARVAKQNLIDADIDQLPFDNEEEEVKVKKPKVEKVTTKIENNDGTHSGYGLAGNQ
jgi:hypothetical protein